RPENTSSARIQAWQCDSVLAALERALGHELRDLAALHADLDPISDLQRDEGVADLDQLAEDPAAGNDLIALGELGEHFALLLHALLLRADEHEVENA